jgi:hypothetical protein
LPILSAHFESSVPGLYFAGLPSAYSFGPVMRFVAGAAFTAHKISVQLAAVGRFPRSPVARLAGATTFRESKTHQRTMGVRW